MKINNKTNISFIIPAYNCENTIEESVFSIIDTNFKNGDEIVIVDDKSTDNTLNILNKLSSKDKSIKIIKHDKNLGGASARNTAVKNAKNDLIFCLDSDNVLEKNSINKLKNFLISNGSDIASFGGLKFFKENTAHITHKWIYQKGQIELQDLFCSPIVPPSSGNYLFTRKSWTRAGGYPESSGALDTWGFGFRQLATGSKMITLKNYYYFHRYGNDSYWVRESRNGKISIIATEIIKPYKDLINKNILSYIENNPNNWFNNLGNIPNIKCGDKAKVIISLREKIRNTFITRLLNRVIYKINFLIKNKKEVNHQLQRVIPWFEVNGDKTLRLNYDLDESSIVIDVGGYEGQWASDIFAKYRCNIIIFEPVKKFYEAIKERFIKNDKIIVYKLGLSNKDENIDISLLNDSSSLFKEDNNSEKIETVHASNFLRKNSINKIDLMKINIEGSEYDLLENLIEGGLINKVKNIQVQFHDFIPNAKERMVKIQNKLKETHHMTYQYEFVWENWEINDK